MSLVFPFWGSAFTVFEHIDGWKDEPSSNRNKTGITHGPVFTLFDRLKSILKYRNMCWGVGLPSSEKLASPRANSSLLNRLPNTLPIALPIALPNTLPNTLPIALSYSQGETPWNPPFLSQIHSQLHKYTPKYTPKCTPKCTPNYTPK